MLVTGGAGFLGQALVRELAAGSVELAHPIELVAYDLVGAPAVQTIRGDILDTAALERALEGFTAVVHCATAVDWSDLRAAHLESINVGGTASVLAACVASGVCVFLHTSTIDVLCGDGDVRDATERTPYPRQFLDAYGRTKADSERLVRAAPASLATVILRFAAMYGEGDPYKVPAMLGEARAGRLLFRIGDGSSRMQPLYVGNAAIATLRALDRMLAGGDEVKGKTLFIADHPPSNFFDWMAPIMKGIGHPIPDRKLPGTIARIVGRTSESIAARFGSRPALSRSSVKALLETITVDDRPTRALLGYQPVYSYEEAVARTVTWFLRENEKT